MLKVPCRCCSVSGRWKHRQGRQCRECVLHSVLHLNTRGDRVSELQKYIRGTICAEWTALVEAVLRWISSLPFLSMRSPWLNSDGIVHSLIHRLCRHKASNSSSIFPFPIAAPSGSGDGTGVVAAIAKQRLVAPLDEMVVVRRQEGFRPRVGKRSISSQAI